jgi:hypothetical protein
MFELDINNQRLIYETNPKLSAFKALLRCSFDPYLNKGHIFINATDNDISDQGAVCDAGNKLPDLQALFMTCNNMSRHM